LAEKGFQKQSQTDVRKLCLQIIEKTLECLGQENLALLFSEFESKGLKRKEIIDRPEKFAEVLQSTFGEAGQMMERFMVLEMCMTFGIDQSNSKMTLADAIGKLRKS
jgi:hypothetical protein